MAPLKKVSLAVIVAQNSKIDLEDLHDMDYLDRTDEVINSFGKEFNVWLNTTQNTYEVSHGVYAAIVSSDDSLNTCVLVCEGLAKTYGVQHPSYVKVIMRDVNL